MASRMNCLIHGILISLLFCTKIFWVERLAQQGISRWLLGFWLHARLSGIYHPKAKGRNFPCSCITMHTIPGPCIFQIQQQIIKLAANLQKDPPKPSTNKTVTKMSSFFSRLIILHVENIFDGIFKFRHAANVILGNWLYTMFYTTMSSCNIYFIIE